MRDGAWARMRALAAQRTGSWQDGEGQRAARVLRQRCGGGRRLAVVEACETRNPLCPDVRRWAPLRPLSLFASSLSLEAPPCLFGASGQGASAGARRRMRGGWAPQPPSLRWHSTHHHMSGLHHAACLSFPLHVHSRPSFDAQLTSSSAPRVFTSRRLPHRPPSAPPLLAPVTRSQPCFRRRGSPDGGVSLIASAISVAHLSPPLRDRRTLPRLRPRLHASSWRHGQPWI